ncbi:MAG: hypothetical protein FJX76_07325 [Armatimonadetes bacterium]|nr:hypothetical protein [Armatimonadota bacterium]
MISATSSATTPVGLSPLLKSSASIERDVFLGTTSALSRVIPGFAGRLAGGITGPLAAISGFGELREGMRTDNTRQVLDGALHMAAGGLTTAAALAPNPIIGTVLAVASLGVLGFKVVMDRPVGLVRLTVVEAGRLVRDAFQAVRNEVGRPAPVSPAPLPAADVDLEQVADMLPGDYNTLEQVSADAARGSKYRHLAAEMHIVPAPSVDLGGGEVFYVEQAAAATPQQPYRQRVYQVTRENGELVNKIYAIDHPEDLINAHQQPGRLRRLDASRLHEMTGCDLQWTRVGDATFVGSAGADGACANTFRGACSASSTVVLTPDSLTSLDLGYDANGSQVWGPPPGEIGHVFRKQPGNGW